jgi:prevent-host-death family protein
MSLKKDVRTVTEMKTGAARLLDQVNEDRRPIVVTKDGRPRGVLLDVESYEEMRNALGLMALALEGLDEVRAGRSLSHAQVQARLDKEFGKSKPHGRSRA